MRILYVTETWAPSVDGVVTRLQATRSQLDRMGHETLVVAPGPGAGHRFTSQAGVVRLPAVGLPFIAGGKPWGLPFVQRMRAAVEAFVPDVVHVLNPFVLGAAGVRVANAAGTPLVASFHQDIAAVAEHYHLGFLREPIWARVRRLHAAAAVNLVTSRAMAAEVAAHGVRRVELWPYGVDLDRFSPRRRTPPARAALVGDDVDAVIALYVGRLAPEKDLHRLRALARAPGVALVVVGDGPLRAELEAQLAGRRVRFTGWLDGPQLADAYASADVFVFPSTTETLGLVLIEALASGLPVVAAKSAPSAEILGDAAVGVLLSPSEWDDLPVVVQDLGAPGRARTEAASAARALAAGWDWAAATERLVELYHQAVDRDRGG